MRATNMRQCACAACGETADWAFCSRDYNRRVSQEKFDYFECRVCGYIFLSPVPSDLGRYYPSDYYDIPKSRAELDARAEETQRGKIDLLNRFISKGRLLEIGPAYGLFAHLAKKNGFLVTGIEMSGKSCAFLRDVVGIHVVEDSNTSRALAALPKQDVIVLWQVIEHLLDPMAVLAAAADRLEPGGLLIIDTPNPKSLQFRLLGSRWAHVDAPRHVALMPLALLVSRAAQLNLGFVYGSSDTAMSRGYNGFGWAYSLKSYFVSERLGRWAFLLGRLIAKVLAPLERTGGRGSTYTAVFSKRGFS